MKLNLSMLAFWVLSTTAHGVITNEAATTNRVIVHVRNSDSNEYTKQDTPAEYTDSSQDSGTLRLANGEEIALTSKILAKRTEVLGMPDTTVEVTRSNRRKTLGRINPSIPMNVYLTKGAGGYKLDDIRMPYSSSVVKVGKSQILIDKATSFVPLKGGVSRASIPLDLSMQSYGIPIGPNNADKKPGLLEVKVWGSAPDGSVYVIAGIDYRRLSEGRSKTYRILQVPLEALVNNTGPEAEPFVESKFLDENLYFRSVFSKTEAGETRVVRFRYDEFSMPPAHVEAIRKGGKPEDLIREAFESRKLPLNRTSDASNPRHRNIVFGSAVPNCDRSAAQMAPQGS